MNGVMEREIRDAVKRTASQREPEICEGCAHRGKMQPVAGWLVVQILAVLF